jgi:fibronectin-binding autotransporter adhesin
MWYHGINKQHSCRSNSAAEGGGIAIVGGTAKIVNPTTIKNNGAAKQGGGIFFSGGTATITGSGGETGTIAGNQAPSGGGIYVVTGKLSLQSSVQVKYNKATAGDGGGMYLGDGQVESTIGFYGVTVSGNTATGKGPGVAYTKFATLNNVATGLTDKDDPGGTPVQV